MNSQNLQNKLRDKFLKKGGKLIFPLPDIEII